MYRAPADHYAQQQARLREGFRGVTIQGGLMIGTIQYVDHKNHLHIQGLSVLPEFRGRGNALKLIDWAIMHSAPLGYDTAVVDIVEETGNVGFFEHIGFMVTKRIESDFFISDTFEVVHHITLEKNIK